MSKILLTGSIHVGKSTTLERLKSRPNRSVAYIPELGREIMNNRPILAPGRTMGEYHFDEQTKRETEAEQAGALTLVCDRGIVDLITHTRLFGKQPKPEWIDWTKTYDRIYLFEIGDIPLHTEGYPPIRDWHQFRQDLDQETRKFLDEQQLQYFCLNGALEDKELRIRRDIEGQPIRLERER